MDTKQIINIAQQFIVSPEGLKLLKKIKIKEVEKVTEAIKLANEERIDDNTNLTAEERKNKRLEAIDAAKDQAKARAGEELSKYLPYLQVFSIKGRLYDWQTKEPIKNFIVRPQLCLFPVTSNPKFGLPLQSIDERDTDGANGPLDSAYRLNQITKEPLKNKDGSFKLQAIMDKGSNGKMGPQDPLNSNITVRDDKYCVITNEKGEFEIRVGLPVLDAQPTIALYGKQKPFLVYKDESKDKPQTDSQRDAYQEGKFKGSTYAPSIQVIVTQAGEVPSELRIHSLYNIDAAAEIAKNKAIEEINQFVIEKIDPYLSLPETFLNNLRKSVLKPATIVQTVMLPLAFELMIFFGIAKEEQANQLQSKCPSNERLTDIVKKRNSIVRQLNNIYGIIIANTALAFLFVYLSKYLKGIKGLIDGLSIPLQFTTYDLTAKLDNITAALERLADVNKDLKKQLIIALVFLIISLIIILRYLGTIDKLISGCKNVDEMETLNAELLAISTQTTEQGEPEEKIVNGFDMSVEVVDKAQVGDLPRRQAIAKNSKGITILKGEPSFSAQDQILIDELSFYIQVNNLKAD